MNDNLTMDQLRIGTEHEVGDVQDLALLIVDPDRKGFMRRRLLSEDRSFLAGRLYSPSVLQSESRRFARNLRRA